MLDDLAADIGRQIEPELVRAWLYALALAPARVMPLLVVLPVFARVGLSGFLRSTLALAMSLLLIPPIAAAVANDPPDGVMLAALMLKEALLGLIIALSFGVIFWGIEAAGNYLDFQRGGAIATDNTNPDHTLVTGSFFGVVFGTYFILAGGLLTALGAIYDSHMIWPVLDFMPSFSDDTADYFFGLLDSIMELGLIVAGPIVIIMFLAEITLALLTRIAPQMNVFILALGVKSALMFLFLPVYLAFLLDRFAIEMEGAAVIEELLGTVLQ